MIYYKNRLGKSLTKNLHLINLGYLLALTICYLHIRWMQHKDELLRGFIRQMTDVSSSFSPFLYWLYMIEVKYRFHTAIFGEQFCHPSTSVDRLFLTLFYTAAFERARRATVRLLFQLRNRVTKS